VSALPRRPRLASSRAISSAAFALDLALVGEAVHYPPGVALGLRPAHLESNFVLARQTRTATAAFGVSTRDFQRGLCTGLCRRRGGPSSPARLSAPTLWLPLPSSSRLPWPLRRACAAPATLHPEESKGRPRRPRARTPARPSLFGLAVDVFLTLPPRLPSRPAHQ
jgi:hypothetical protein